MPLPFLIIHGINFPTYPIALGFLGSLGFPAGLGDFALSERQDAFPMAKNQSLDLPR